jgi:hypothetical protein
MDAGSPGQHRDIHTVVNDQHRAALAAHLGDRARRREQFAARRVFEPKLHHARAALQQDARERNRLMAARRIDHRIEMRGKFHLIASRGARG